MIKELYENQLKYNCDFITMTHNNEDFVLVFLGTDDFVVTCHYWGVVGYGVRHYDHETNTAKYDVVLPCQSVSFSTVDRIIKRYERVRLKRDWKVSITGTSTLKL